MERQLQAGGDFAHAYVIAHEVGHHVQNVLGISGRVHEMRQRVSQAEGNQLSVRVELQADCFAGLWGNRANKAGLLEPGDVEEALRAAAAIGDDRLQRGGGGSVNPDSFTHGTSEQRNRWLHRGLDTGSFEACDTFKAADL
jgi:predicted metalloprotease